MSWRFIQNTTATLAGNLMNRMILALSLLTLATCSRVDKPTFFRAMVYTQAFAQRYGLPESGIEQLVPELYAIVYRIVAGPGEPPVCSLDFYLNDQLDLDYPSGDNGIRTYPDSENPLFFDHTVDERWEKVRGNFHTIGCRTNTNCEAQTSSMSAYWRHLAPGIALQSHDIVCTMLDPTVTGPTEMWLLHAGVDSRKVIDLLHADGDGVFAIRIPERLLIHSAPHTRKAIAFFDRPLPPDKQTGKFEVPAKR